MSLQHILITFNQIVAVNNKFIIIRGPGEYYQEIFDIIESETKVMEVQIRYKSNPNILESIDLLILSLGREFNTPVNIFVLGDRSILIYTLKLLFENYNNNGLLTSEQIAEKYRVIALDSYDFSLIETKYTFGHYTISTFSSSYLPEATVEYTSFLESHFSGALNASYINSLTFKTYYLLKLLIPITISKNITVILNELYSKEYDLGFSSLTFNVEHAISSPLFIVKLDSHYLYETVLLLSVLFPLEIEYASVNSALYSVCNIRNEETYLKYKATYGIVLIYKTIELDSYLYTVYFLSNINQKTSMILADGTVLLPYFIMINQDTDLSATLTNIKINHNILFIIAGYNQHSIDRIATVSGELNIPFYYSSLYSGTDCFKDVYYINPPFTTLAV